MKIRIKGEMTLAQVRQALFEQLRDIEERYAVRHSIGLTLYIRPSNGFGDDVRPVYPNGKEVSVVYGEPPYRCAADQYDT